MKKNGATNTVNMSLYNCNKYGVVSIHRHWKKSMRFEAIARYTERSQEAITDITSI